MRLAGPGRSSGIAESSDTCTALPHYSYGQDDLGEKWAKRKLHLQSLFSPLLAVQTTLWKLAPVGVVCVCTLGCAALLC